MLRIPAAAALALLAVVAWGCSSEGAAEVQAEVSAGGEAPTLVVPEAALDMVPGNMHLLVHVDAEALRSSGIMGVLVQEAHEGDDLDDGERAAIDYFAAQSDALLCAFRYDAGGSQLPFACVVTGRFAGWSLVGSLLDLDDGEVGTDAHGFTILHRGGATEDEPSVLVLDDRHILIAQPRLLEEVFGAMGDPSARLSAQADFAALAQATAFGQHAASLLGLVPAGLREVLSEGTGQDPGRAFLAQLAAQVQGITARVDVSDVTALTVALHATTPEGASDLASLVGLLLRVAASSGDEPQIADLLARVEVGVESSQVMLRWAAPTTEVLARLADVVDKPNPATEGAAPSP